MDRSGIFERLKQHHTLDGTAALLLSRLLNLLAQDANLTTLHNSLLNLAMWRLSSTRGGKPLPPITLDAFRHWNLPERSDQIGALSQDDWVCRNYCPVASLMLVPHPQQGRMVGVHEVDDAHVGLAGVFTIQTPCALL